MMERNTLGIAVLAALMACVSACGSTPAPPLAPSGTSGASGNVGGPSLRASAPVTVSPLNNVTTSSLTPSLVVSGGGLTNASGAVQYRFRVTDTTGVPAADSGLVSSTTWVPSAPLTPTTSYTWTARSEYQGLTGPWSSPATFRTPAAPGNDYGAWESTCQGLVDEPLVVCVWSFVRPGNSFEDFEVVKRVAWLMRGKGAGLLLKGSGENVVPWMGRNFSGSRICFPNGRINKIIGDAGPGGANNPIFGADDFVAPSLYVPAIDPRLR